MTDYNAQWYFEVYGPFGRVIERFYIGKDETHHAASEKARLKCASMKNKRTWIRLIKH
jgi:hypothetical protein